MVTSVAGKTITTSTLMGLPAKPYVLKNGETPATIATSIGLTYQQLQSFNQFRSFSKPFANLGPGDEIDIPAPTMAIVLTSQDMPDSSRSQQENDSELSTLASHAQMFGGLLNTPDTTKAVAGMTRTIASDVVNDAIYQWLSQFGTIEARLSLDEKDSLANSSLDGLIPLYKNYNNNLFTQLGIRNKDERNTINLGLGYRMISGDWLYGINSFYDDDITGHNRRFGFGYEARTDYMQLASNTYMRLSGWHQSRDFDDYDERPANGFDIRAKGWIPAYPQLGGKFIYEQYYGKEVALFNKNDRQRNPFAITAGLSWTPFPLLTIGVDERIGKGGKNETNMNLLLTWHPDESWDSQISPESVASYRQIRHSMFDLVDRNNNIVLEYRKKELVFLTLSQNTIIGSAGSSQIVNVKVAAKYGLQTINWDASTLTTAGGSLNQLDNTRFSITLPPFKNLNKILKINTKNSFNVLNDPNVYVLTVVARDTKGNISSPQHLTVIVLSPEPEFDGPPQVLNDGAPADAKSPVTVTVHVTDHGINPLANQRVTFLITYADGSKDSQTITSDEHGSASANITSSVPGEATVAISTGNTSQYAKIHFAADDVIDSAHSSLSVIPQSITANGRDSATIILHARDAKATPVTGKSTQITFPATGISDLVISPSTESPDNSGNYTAKISGLRSGVAKLNVAYGGKPIQGLNTLLTLHADSETAGLTNPGASLTVIKDKQPADDLSTNIVKAIVTDAMVIRYLTQSLASKPHRQDISPWYPELQISMV